MYYLWQKQYYISTNSFHDMCKKKWFQAKFIFTHCIVEYSKGKTLWYASCFSRMTSGFQNITDKNRHASIFFHTCHHVSYNNLSGIFFIVQFWDPMHSLFIVKKRSSCMRRRRKIWHVFADRLELSMLHLLSGIPNQLPVQLIPPSSDFPFSHRLSVSDVGGTVILKGERSEHLTSFPNTALPRP